MVLYSQTNSQQKLTMRCNLLKNELEKKSIKFNGFCYEKKDCVVAKSETCSNFYSPRDKKIIKGYGFQYSDGELVEICKTAYLDPKESFHSSMLKRGFCPYIEETGFWGFKLRTLGLHNLYWLKINGLKINGLKNKRSCKQQIPRMHCYSGFITFLYRWYKCNTCGDKR